MVNKIDRGILELQTDGESMFNKFQKVLENVNVIIATYDDVDMGDNQVHPAEGTVAFGSGLHGWAFTVTFFARVLSEKFKVDTSVLMQKLWGEWFYDTKNKKWVQQEKSAEGETFKRGFAQFIMDPIIRLANNIMNNNKDAVWKMLTTLNIEIKEVDKEKIGKDLLKHIYQRWINAADALLEMICLHLPSPKKAQAYRAGYLYEGPIDDVCG